MSEQESLDWMGLAIGNSRLHWVWFHERQLKLSWNSEYLTETVVNNNIPGDVFPYPLLRNKLSRLPVCLASVVPAQTNFWQKYTPLHQIELADIPLQGVYPTMGIDRALAVWGAGKTYGFPCLVIDAGTALTFTGVDDRKNLIGGAILPGLSLQLKSLAERTAALPAIKLTPSLPHRWALTTTQAIESGIVHTILAGINSFITDWSERFPQSTIVFTGGDTNLLENYWRANQQKKTEKVIFDTNLLFWGMKWIYRA